MLYRVAYKDADNNRKLKDHAHAGDALIVRNRCVTVKVFTSFKNCTCIEWTTKVFCNLKPDHKTAMIRHSDLGYFNFQYGEWQPLFDTDCEHTVAGCIKMLECWRKLQRNDLIESTITPI